MRKLALLTCVLAVAAAGPVLAANAEHPYSNCNRQNDNCGPTGNSTTDQLNARQLSAPGTTAPMAMQAEPMGADQANNGENMPAKPARHRAARPHRMPMNPQ